MVSVSATALTRPDWFIPRASHAEVRRKPGRAVLNMSTSYNGSAYPFLNWAKSTQHAPVVFNPRPPSYDFNENYNADGYPTIAPQNGNSILGRLRIPTNYSGNWVIKWKGASVIVVSLGVKQTSNIAVHHASRGAEVEASAAHLILRGTDARVVFSLPNWQNTGSLDIIFPSGATISDFSNLVICQEAEEHLLDDGEIYRPDFLKTLKALNPSTIRFLDWSAQLIPGLISDFRFENKLNTLCWADGRIDSRLWVGDIGGVVGVVGKYQCSAPPHYPGGFPAMPTDGAMI